MKVMIQFPTNGDLDRALSRWWAWLAGKDWAELSDICTIHSIDYHYCTAGPDHARNQIVEKFLATDATHLWMIDRDTVPPYDLTLLGATRKIDAPLLSGVYDSFHAEKGVGFPQVYKKVGPHTWKTQPKIIWPKGEFFRADAVGAGCLLIRRSLLENMPPPWFEFGKDERGRLIAGEDMIFCDKAGGVTVMPSYQCEHYKQMPMSTVRQWSEAIAEFLAT